MRNNSHFSLSTFHFSLRARLRAQALVEYAIVFPLQLILTLSIIQLAHIFVAKQVLEYGAFCAARSYLVNPSLDDARKAAAIPISLIAGPTGVTTTDAGVGIVIPGWTSRTVSAQVASKLRESIPGRGPSFSSYFRSSRWDEESAALEEWLARQASSQYLSRAGAAMEKTPSDEFVITRDTSTGTPVIRCELTHYYELRVPIGNVVAYKLGDVFLAAEDLLPRSDYGGAPHVRMKASCFLAQPWSE